MTKKPSYRLSGGLFDRETETTDVKRLFFLSVEGDKTEPSYFKNLGRVLRDIGVADATIHVLEHPRDGLSTPQDVYSLVEDCQTLREGEDLLPVPVLEDLKKRFSYDEIMALLSDGNGMTNERKQEFHDLLLSLGINVAYRKYIKTMPSEEDCFAVVFDRDRECHSRECVEDVVTRCRERRIICCLSNPCFELWLLLHLVEAESVSQPQEKRRIAENAKISNRHTYVSKRVSDIARHAKNISAKTFDRFYKPNLRKAIASAKMFEQEEGRILDEVGTSVPKVIEKILVQRNP